MNRPCMFGRQVIYTDTEVITDSNVINEINNAMNTHLINRAQICYLWDYYRGNQAILSRTKKVRPEICNKIVENRANEIVSFKVGYLCGEPIQYVGRNSKKGVSKGISELNEMMFSSKKASQDKNIAEWQAIAGTAYRMVLPQKKDVKGVPFRLFSLDPRDSFVVYRNDIGNEPLYCVKYRITSENISIFSVYTADWYWKIENSKIVESRPNPLGMLPIVEYPANTARLGAFEIVIDLLDELNNVASNRMDGIEQLIQSFIKFINCDIDEEKFKALKDLGAIKVKSIDGQKADVDVVESSLDQAQTQVTKDDIYDAILTICGMPNRNGGSSTSDTGAAVIMRDGWSDAEARAKESELIFKDSEMDMLKIVLRILKDNANVSKQLSNLKIGDFEPKFTRRNYDNIQSKAQVLDIMLKNGKIHPRLAFTSCGMFSDPENAYQQSMEYLKEEIKTDIENPNLQNIENDIEGKSHVNIEVRENL